MTPLENPRTQPRRLRAWAIVVALIATLPLVAFAASAQESSGAESSGASGDSPSYDQPPEPPQDEWTYERPPEPARVSLRLEPDELRLEAGERATAAYALTNEGPEPVDVRVTAHSPRDGILVSGATSAWHHLAPGETVRGDLVVHALDGHAGVHFVHVEAETQQGEPRMTMIALLRVHVPLELRALPIDFPTPPMPAAPERHACAPAPWKPVWWMPLPRVSSCAPPPPPEPAFHHARGAPCEPRVIHDDGSFLLHLALRGRIEGDKLVIDLDPTLRAMLESGEGTRSPPPTEPTREHRGGW